MKKESSDGPNSGRAELPVKPERVSVIKVDKRLVSSGFPQHSIHGKHCGYSDQRRLQHVGTAQIHF